MAARPFKVWLVESAGALSAASGREGQLVHDGVRTQLDRWFTAALRNRNARSGLPTGRSSRCDVTWNSAPTTGQVDGYDVVIHFEPSTYAPGRSATAQTPSRSYHTAAGNVGDRRLRTQLRQAVNPQGGAGGGYTVRASLGSAMVPIFSVVYVLYDGQLSHLTSRVQANVEKLSIAAFHEAAHNKDDTNSLHTAGGGGVFADIHTGSGRSATAPNARNTGFLATRIWNFGPQFLVGRPLTPVVAP